jgi:hypothetical protein
MTRCAAGHCLSNLAPSALLAEHQATCSNTSALPPPALQLCQLVAVPANARGPQWQRGQPIRTEAPSITPAAGATPREPCPQQAARHSARQVSTWWRRHGPCCILPTSRSDGAHAIAYPIAQAHAIPVPLPTAQPQQPAARPQPRARVRVTWWCPDSSAHHSQASCQGRRASPSRAGACSWGR